MQNTKDDDISFTKPTDHGTVGAVASQASGLSYDDLSSDDSSIHLQVHTTSVQDGHDIPPPEIGMNIVCGHSKAECDLLAAEHAPHHSHAHGLHEDESQTSSDEEFETFIHPKEEPTLEKIAEYILSGKIKKIMVLSGAGISCSAGIPDFRTPGSGLYDNLEKYNLPYPEAVFDLNYYLNDPMPFVSLAAELWPGRKHSPTIGHSFLALLDKKKLLVRNYSQNIDGLELLAGVSEERLVECHGHFRTASCISCGIPFDGVKCRDTICEDGEAPICIKCGCLVKPDIVFFGESLPIRFKKLLHDDLSKSDLLIVLGTSLKVAPVSLIPEMVHSRTPRILMNRELVGDFVAPGTDGNHRDVFVEGDVDDSVRTLCSLLGWEEELMQLNEQTRLKVE